MELELVQPLHITYKVIISRKKDNYSESISTQSQHKDTEFLLSCIRETAGMEDIADMCRLLEWFRANNRKKSEFLARLEYYQDFIAGVN